MISNISCSIAFFFPKYLLYKKERKVFLRFCLDTTGFISCMEAVMSPVNPCGVKEAVILNWLHDNLHSAGFQNPSLNQCLFLLLLLFSLVLRVIGLNPKYLLKSLVQVLK